MFALLTVLLAAVPIAYADLEPRFYENYKFQNFVKEYGRSYSSAEEYSYRESVFNENIEFIRKQNQAYLEGRSRWVAGLNNFGDMSAKHMQPYLGLHKQSLWKQSAETFTSASSLTRLHNGSIPESVDWRNKSVVTPPKDQGGCGDCWAFSATESIESHVALNTGKLLTLAPQELTSCASNPQKCGGTGGCEGGIQDIGFNYAKANGLALETDYPYEGKDSSCHKAEPAAYVDGFERLPINDGDALAKEPSLPKAQSQFQQQPKCGDFTLVEFSMDTRDSRKAVLQTLTMPFSWSVMAKHPTTPTTGWFETHGVQNGERMDTFVSCEHPGMSRVLLTLNQKMVYVETDQCVNVLLLWYTVVCAAFLQGLVIQPEHVWLRSKTSCCSWSTHLSPPTTPRSKSSIIITCFNSYYV